MAVSATRREGRTSDDHLFGLFRDFCSRPGACKFSSTVLARLRSAAVLGVEAMPVDVEVDVTFGMPIFRMVGLPDAGVRESRERVRSAIRNSGFEFPLHRITVNLAPADVRKAGTSFDLPIALGILAATGIIERRHIDDVVLVGELSLDGAIQPTRGVLPIAALARRVAASAIVLPATNAAEARVVGGLRIFPVSSLAEAVEALNGGRRPLGDRDERPTRSEPPDASPESTDGDFSEVRGQALARRAFEIAAAGGHNLLVVGPPGGGKTMMARRLPGVLPPLAFEEALESSAIHSVAGLLPPGAGLLAARPFRAPHHTISDVALVGGGPQPRPGEISLAHNGVLFLDEVPEFHRHALEVLRQPLEEGRITIARAARAVVLPARFVLVAAMNPCPCGFLGDAMRQCQCTPLQVARYRMRLSGPLRDRIDLGVEVPALPVEAMATDAGGESTAAIRARVVGAREVQRARLESHRLRVNAQVHGRLLVRYCRPDTQGMRLLRTAAERMGLSARGFDRVLKVARTVADLEGAESVEARHVAEALQFRLSE